MFGNLKRGFVTGMRILLLIVFLWNPVGATFQLASAAPTPLNLMPTNFFDPLAAGLTVAGLVQLGRTLKEVIATAGVTGDASVARLSERIDGMIAEIEETYKDSLNLTIDQLDNYTDSTLRQFAQLLQQVDQIFGNGIGLINDVLRQRIDQISDEMDALRIKFEASVKDVIFVGGVTAVYAVNRTFYDLLAVVALVIAGIGLIVFVATLIQAKGLPRGTGGILTVVLMIIFIGAFGSIALVPKARAFVLRFAGPTLAQELQSLPQEPLLVHAAPSPILLGSTPTPELHLHGVDLQPNGELPSASINGTPVPIIAADNNEVVLGVGNYPPPSNSSASVELVYLTTTARPNIVVRFITPTPTVPILTPPDLVVSLRLDPSISVTDNNVRAEVVVSNYGETAATNFEVEWKMTGQESQGQVQSVGRVDGNSSTTISFNGVYKLAGIFLSTLIVDPHNSVVESNETNNNAVLSVEVQPRPQSLVISKYFLFYPNVVDPSENTAYYPDIATLEYCGGSGIFDPWELMKRAKECLDRGLRSTTPTQVQSGDRIVIHTEPCQKDAPGSDPKLYCVTGGSGRPGSWGPEGVEHYDVNFPEFPFTGKLFQLGYKLNEVKNPLGSGGDFVYNGSPTALYLIINDTTLGDNAGFWYGTIEIWR